MRVSESNPFLQFLLGICNQAKRVNAEVTKHSRKGVNFFLSMFVDTSRPLMLTYQPEEM